MLAIKTDAQKPRYDIFTTYVHDIPLLVQSDGGYSRATYTGVVWRISADNYCFNAWWPSKEAAEMFINEMKAFKWTLK